MMKRVLSLLIALAMLISVAPFVSAEGEVIQSYDLTRPGDSPDEATIAVDGWQENRDVSTPYIFSVAMADNYASYNGQFSKIRLVEVGQYYALNFNVETEGLYQIRFKGFVANGICSAAAIKVDGQYVGSYDFANEGANETYVTKDLATANLTAGIHEFAFVRSGEAGSGYFFFSTLELVSAVTPIAAGADPIPDVAYTQTVHLDTGAEGMPTNTTYVNYNWAINTALTSDFIKNDTSDFVQYSSCFKTHFASVGNVLGIDFYVDDPGDYNIDFSSLCLDGYGPRVSFYVDGNYVGIYHITGGGGGTFLNWELGGLSLSRGKHTLKIKRIANPPGFDGWGYMWAQHLVLTPTATLRSAPIITQAINFCQPLTDSYIGATIEANGWALDTEYTTPRILNDTSYLATYNVFTKARPQPGEVLTYQFNVEGAGLYAINLQGYVAAEYGSKCIVSIDGTYLGTYNFCTDASKNLSGLNLTSGIHRLSFVRYDTTEFGLTTLVGMTLTPSASVSAPEPFPVFVNFMNVETVANATLSANGWEIDTATTNLSFGDGDFINGLYTVDAVLGARARFNDGETGMNEILAIKFNVLQGAAFEGSITVGQVAGFGAIFNVYIDGIYAGEIDSRDFSGAPNGYTVGTSFDLNPMNLSTGVHTLSFRIKDLNTMFNGQLWLESFNFNPISSLSMSSMTAGDDASIALGSSFAAAPIVTMSNSDVYAFGLNVQRAIDNNNKVTGVSSDESVLTVDEYGVITAVGKGTATVTVTATVAGQSMSDTIDYTVTANTPTGTYVSGNTKPVSIKFIQTGSGKEFVTTATGGVFSCDIPSGEGTYTILFTALGCTSYTKQNVTISGNDALGGFSIYPGEITGDGIINVIDIASIISRFGNAASGTDIQNLNNDFIINADDIAIVISNIGRRSTIE